MPPDPALAPEEVPPEEVPPKLAPPVWFELAASSDPQALARSDMGSNQAASGNPFEKLWIKKFLRTTWSPHPEERGAA